MFCSCRGPADPDPLQSLEIYRCPGNDRVIWHVVFGRLAGTTQGVARHQEAGLGAARSLLVFPGLTDHLASQQSAVAVLALSFAFPHQSFRTFPRRPPGQPRGCRFRGSQSRGVLRLVIQSDPTLCNSIDCSPPGSSVPRDSPGKNNGVGFHALSWIIQTQRSNPGSCFADSLSSEPPGKPKNT